MTPENDQAITEISGFVWVAIITGLLLTIPLIAMQFTDEVSWNIGDFVIMGAMLFGLGSTFVLISRKVERNSRIAAAILLAVIFLWLWAELAVGVFTNWGD